MMREPWIGDESQLAAIARQVFVRALRRPWRVLVIAVLITGAYVWTRAHAAPTYEATLYFNMVEGDLTDPNNTPRPLRSIREYISNVALSRARVERLMTKYHLSDAYLARDRVAAIDAFREDIRIDVTRNYFLYDRIQFNAPRSAQIAISTRGGDPERARAILREIGDAILQEQLAARADRLGQARDVFGSQLLLARTRTRLLQQQIDRLWLDLARADPRGAIWIQARIAGLQADIKGAIEQVVALERRAADVAFTAAAEGNQLGLNFELFDESLVTTAPRLTPFQLARLATVVFIMVLVLTVPVVGAFDDRIYSAHDLEVYGLPFFGALPRFNGDDAGSYRARRQTGVYNS
jgi:hypothetical protein